MLDQLIGKNVEITVAFASVQNSHHGGAASLPVCYLGILKAMDNDYCVVALKAKRLAYLNPRSTSVETCSGDIYIRKDSILTCHELPSQ